MVSIYEILTDKYGEYYVSYGKKRRIKTLKEKNNKVDEKIDEMIEMWKNKISKQELDEMIEEYDRNNYIHYKYIFLNGKKYIEFGG